MPSPLDPTNPSIRDHALDIRGALPVGLSGRLVGIGPDGVVHSFRFHGGRVAHLSRRIVTSEAVQELVGFDGALLTFGEQHSVRELTVEAGALRRVDLAGRRRPVAACPTYDSSRRELHLVASDWGGAQTHVVVPAGALTRRSRPLADASAPIQGLAVGFDHVVFVADGFVGVASRDGDVHTSWTATGAVAPRPVHTHRTGDTVVLVAHTPSLELWVLHPDGRAAERDVLDPTPRRYAHDAGRVVWTTGGETIGRHDPVTSRSTHLHLPQNAPGDFVVVPDPARASGEAGWFVGFVHHASSRVADLVVIDTADLAGAALAVIRVSPPITAELRCAWLPAAPQ